MLAAAGPVLFAMINVWTRLHDQPELRAGGRMWEVMVWEGSSALMTLALLPLAAYAARALIERPPSWRLVLTIAACTLGFYFAHVGGFMVLRMVAYMAFGSRYQFMGLSAWLYELPKDMVTFAILVAVLTLSLLMKRSARPETGEAELPLHIRDGARTYVVRPSQVLAVAAAGNYVEYHLSDGRRPLSRARLADAEVALACAGFLRTHRSWLVNGAHIREIRALGGGEYEVILSDALTAPVSRRHAHLVHAALTASAIPRPS